MSHLTLFRDIDELVTLKAARKKQARRVEERDLSIQKQASILCHRGKILWSGRWDKLPSHLKPGSREKVKEYSLKGYSVLPSFTECHTHLIFAGDRSDEFELRNQGVTYQEIAQRGGGILSTVKATRKASQEKLLQLAQSRTNEFIRQGVTAVEVKSGYGLNFKSEVKMLQVAGQIKGADIVRTYLGAHAIPKEAKNSEEYLKTILGKHLPYVAQNQLADRVDMFVESGYFSEEQAHRYFHRARQLGLEITAHVEQLTRTGGSVVAAHLGAQSVDHLVQVSRRDIDQLSQSKSTCVLLPAADFYLKMDYPPARRLIDAGARVALATDFNPGSSPTQDLSFVGLLARLEMKMTLPEVLVAYTLGSSWALGRQDVRGSIEPGRDCDLMVLDGSWKSLFYRVGYHPVCEVWKKGKRLFKRKC